jgi:tetratricopeptide (TPR) repeat protein
MNDQANNPATSNGSEPWRQVMEQTWARLLNDDPSEFDIEMVAAFAEGNLNDEQAAAVMQMLAESPAALDCFLAIREHLTPERPAKGDEPFLETLTAAFEPDTTAGSTREVSLATPLEPGKTLQELPGELLEPIPAVAQEQQGGVGYSSKDAGSFQQTVAPAPSVLSNTARAYGGALALALGLLLFLAAAWLRWDSNDQLALEREQMAVKIAERELLSRKEIGHFLASQNGLRYLSGQLTARLVDTTATVFPRAKGANRSGPAEQMQSSMLAEDWKSSIDYLESLTGETDDLQLERLFAMLSEGAERTVQERLAKLPPDVAAEPRWQNLHAIALLYQADNLSILEAEPLVARARELLKDITARHPDFALAWLNLALLAETDYEPRDTVSAVEYLRKFLELQTDDSIKASLELRLSNQ